MMLINNSSRRPSRTPTQPPRFSLGRLTALALAASVLGGCAPLENLWSGVQGTTSYDPPIVPIRNMYDQDRYDDQGESGFFPDHRMMRQPVVGTVAREMEVDHTLTTGRTADDAGWIPAIPEQVIARNNGLEAFATRGEERFNIYCAPCHDRAGTGNGMIVKHGLVAPPSYHQDRIRHMPDGQLFATITNGIRNMPGYYAQIPVDDRWAIVAYVRALQLSQSVNEEKQQ